jgi:multidrug resistance efflux pump
LVAVVEGHRFYSRLAGISRAPLSASVCRVACGILKRMMRWIALPLIIACAATLAAQDELPKNPEEPTDIEPPLLIQEAPNQNIVYTRPDAPDRPVVADPDQIAASLEKARKSAASGERLYKSGIIAKVDAENRALKVIRLEAELAEAKLELARQNVLAQEARVEAGEILASEVEVAKSIELAALKEEEAAVAKKEKAELDAAQLNLRRQQKLLAMGSGRKAEVNRAQEKVSALQQKN